MTIAGPLAGAVVAIGNFDGVHRGHRAVIAAALQRARGALGRKAAALDLRAASAPLLPAAGAAVPALERARQAAPARRHRARRRHRHDLRRRARRHRGRGLRRAASWSAASASAARRSASISISARTARGSPDYLRRAGRPARLCRRHRAAARGRGPAGFLRRGARRRWPPARWWRRPSCSARPGSSPAR